MIDAEEIKRELDLEFFCQRESLAYKTSRGTSGMQINAKYCPSCGDSRYRVYLNLETGLGNCFKCNQPFNKLSFVHLTLGTKWPETFHYCGEVLREQGWRPKREVAAAVDMGEVKLPESHELPTPAGQNLVYLEQRGITGTLAKYFGLRWCEYGWFPTFDHEGKPFQQEFSSRVIIPVFDLDGQLKTFQGRDLTGTKDRKYLFPVGLPGTGRYLLNGQNVSLTDEVVMGEGFFDVAATKIALDEEVALRHIVPVGSFGKHLSYGSETGDDQLGRFLQLKHRGLKIVTIMWDGEVDALIAALNAAKILTGIGLKVRIALLPFDKDPNEVPPDVVRQAYYEAQLWTPALDVKWRLRNPYAAAAQVAKGKINKS